MFVSSNYKKIPSIQELTQQDSSRSVKWSNYSVVSLLFIAKILRGSCYTVSICIMGRHFHPQHNGPHPEGEPPINIRSTVLLEITKKSTILLKRFTIL